MVPVVAAGGGTSGEADRLEKASELSGQIDPVNPSRGAAAALSSSEV
jgi:hypothetical protein